MTKEQLIAELSEKWDINKATATRYYGEFIKTIRDEIISSQKCELSGLGTFRVKTRAQKKGINPRTKEPMIIPEHKVVCFNPCKELREIIAQK